MFSVIRMMMETLRRVRRWPNRGKLYIHSMLEEERTYSGQEKKGKKNKNYPQHSHHSSSLEKKIIMKSKLNRLEVE